MDQDAKAKEVVRLMNQTDQFSNWLGMEVLESRHGFCKIQLRILPHMVNSFGTGHGGVAFSLADTAFAYACNSNGKVSVVLEVSISFTKPVQVNDLLIAEARAIHSTRKTGVYMVEVTNASHELVALFKGTCYRIDKHQQEHSL
jgi:acyl-CoA thioesterase